VDIAAERLALAKQFGADALINSRETDPVKAIKDLTHGEGAEATMDCTGLPEPRVAAVRSAATWGRMCFVGEGGATSIDVSRDLIRKQLTLVASWTFSSMGQWECARFVADRKIPLGRIFTDHFRLDEAAAAYQRFDTQTTGKGVFTAF